jgi:hypothetical protein
MDVIPLRTENQALSGQEFVDFVNRLGRIQRTGKPLALASEEGAQSGEAVIPAGAPNQLLDQSSVSSACRTRHSAPPRRRNPSRSRNRDATIVLVWICAHA